MAITVSSEFMGHEMGSALEVGFLNIERNRLVSLEKTFAT
jgi:hypothetical protein